MIKRLLLIVALTGLAACAGKEPKETKVELHVPFEAITPTDDALLVLNGVVTVDQVHQRSDIIIMPPSIQHVVWKRHRLPQAAEAGAGTKSVTPAERPPRATVRRAREQWPLLERDMDFESQIGSVAMCERTTLCPPEADCLDLEPCRNPQDYECFAVKQGEYCLEAIR